MHAETVEILLKDGWLFCTFNNILYDFHFCDWMV